MKWYRPYGWHRNYLLRTQKSKKIYTSHFYQHQRCEVYVALYCTSDTAFEIVVEFRYRFVDRRYCLLTV
jgi:hypothetical protein